MKIAVISDIHENFHNLLKALEIIREKGVQKILCLGDFINPGVAKVLVDCGIPTYAIWGNNDGDKVLITKMSMAPGSSLELGDKTYAMLEVDGRSIFLTHYPDLVAPAAASGMYDVVFYGHDHLRREGQEGDCLVANPGELAAFKTKKATFLVYDTEENLIEFLDIKDAATLKTEFVEGVLSA